MSNTEYEYLKSYDRPGCFPVFAYLLIVILLISIILNIALFKQLKRYEETSIESKALADQKTSHTGKANGNQEKSGFLPYYQVEEREPVVQDGESIVRQVLPEGTRCAQPGNGSYHSPGHMSGSLGSRKLAGSL